MGNSSKRGGSTSTDAGLKDTVPSDGGSEPSDDEAHLLERGSTIGRYLIVEHLGAGAMGIVYAAYDPELDRKVAIKLLRPEPNATASTRGQARLVREAKAMAKLSHPNVGAIFDVGVHDGRVFLAMEYLPGGTLRAWLEADKRPWRDIVRMFVDIGNGLAAAHAEGLIHRDFKPDNVLLDKTGKPKVVDFGLVRVGRNSDTDLSTTGSVDPDSESPTDPAFLSTAATLPVALTRTGAMTGTPAYMAPEQFLGKPVDERTDQFAFCVALYEALYRERPFAGDNILSLADSVIHGSLREPPKSSEVPAWVARLLRRGLQKNPTARMADIHALTRQLASDPGALRRRIILTSVGVLGATALLVWGVRAQINRRTETAARVKQHLDEGNRLAGIARGLSSNLKEAREQAYRLFDQRDASDGELIWKRSYARLSELSRDQAAALKAFEAARAVDPGRDDVVQTVAAWTCEAANQWADLGVDGDLLAKYAKTLPDPGACGISAGPARLAIGASRPASVSLERFEYNDSGVATVVRTIALGTTPLEGVSAEPGLVRLTFTAADGTRVLLPLQLKAGEVKSLSLDLPNRIPAGFAYIPAGPFFFGDDDETLRTGFLSTVPLHEVHTGSYFIARHEVTYADWMAFLDDQPAATRKRLAPRVASAGFRGLLELRELPEGGWQLRIQAAGRTLEARAGEQLVYPARDRNASVDWLRLPVTGVSADDIKEYLDWFTRKHGLRVRLCDEREWERAARGADKRIFPHGMTLAPTDANFDETYGRDPLAQGPDPVGSYPKSRSPFDIDDMTGNV
ncbi:MAG TPA: bifunctional serine/threonine-protein kinase/formylglycine-generating enzyme family protein, partial [Polyangia bacterium]|nr:bifunctional serine/threonine-protein kinase/formylglycine-generating enzyme family protein [Polyangia bacterium]